MNIAFLLIDNFSLISFSSAIEPLRIANKIIGEKYFKTICVSLDGKEVTSSSGIPIGADKKLSSIEQIDLIIICSSDDVEYSDFDNCAANDIRKLEAHGAKLGAICTGSFLLAKYKLLKGRSCTIHWEYLTQAKELFASANFEQQLIVYDRNLITAAGGTTPMEMMINLISNELGQSMSKSVQEIAIHHEKRKGGKSQRLDTVFRYNVHDPEVIQCIDIMEKNIEEPLDLNVLCKKVGLSRRQIERKFEKYINQPPAKFYAQLRLERAKELVAHTTMKVGEITYATGFQNPTHFTRLFKAHFGITPTTYRRSIN